MAVTRRDFLAATAAGAVLADPGIGCAEQADLVVNGEGKTYDSKPSFVLLPDGSTWMATFRIAVPLFRRQRFKAISP